MVDLLDIGDAVRARRRELKITLPQLAEKSGVSRARIADLERQKISEIGFKNLARILHALGLDLRITTLNQSRPTLEDLIEESMEPDDSRVVRQKARRHT